MDTRDCYKWLKCYILELNKMLYFHTQNLKIDWNMYHNAIHRDSITLQRLRALINIKIVDNTPGYPVELNHHNALTFSQRAALGHPVLVSATTPETVINMSIQAMNKAGY